jgi:hypothetical protein
LALRTTAFSSRKEQFLKKEKTQILKRKRNWGWGGKSRWTRQIKIEKGKNELWGKEEVKQRKVYTYE